MKLDRKTIIVAAILLVAAVGGYWGWKNAHAPVVTTTVEKPSTQTSSDTVKFAPDAPQLTFLKIKPVETFPEPLIDGLNARIAYDDNYTARVFSVSKLRRVIRCCGSIHRTMPAALQIA